LPEVPSPSVKAEMEARSLGAIKMVDPVEREVVTEAYAELAMVVAEV